MSRVLYRGGVVHCSLPGATALLVDGSRIAWIGSDPDVAGLGAPDAVVELDGAWLAPAFVDAHVHTVAGGLALSGLDLSAARSLLEVLQRVEETAAKTAPGALIWGSGWDETSWSGGPQRPPTPAELARAGGARPVYLSRVDVHSAAVSPRVLAAAGLDPTDHAVRGEQHHAVRRVARGLLTPSQRRSAADVFLAEAGRLGIAMVHECCGPEIGDTAELDIVRDAARASGHELVAYWGEAGAAGVARAHRHGAEPAGDLFVDGSLGSHTAALHAPYADDTSSGTLFLSAEAVGEHLVAATNAGAQAGFHVIGDAALSTIIEGFGHAEQRVGLPALARGRHRLEHLEMCEPRHLPALSRYGIIASVQPAFQARWGGPDRMYASRLGADRAAAMNDFAALLGAGVPLAFGSDAPVTPLDPWGALAAATSSSGEPAGSRATSRAVSERAAFAAHTRGGYRAARLHGGVIAVGEAATFAVWTGVGALGVRPADGRIAAWSTDPRSASPGLPNARTVTPECVFTVVGGRAVHDPSGRLSGVAARPSTERRADLPSTSA